jgi:hypothetical protein
MNQATSPVEGKIGQGLLLNNSAIYLPTFTQAGQTYTFAMWAKLNNNTGYLFDSLSGGVVLNLGTNASLPNRMTWYDGAFHQVGSTDISTGVWHHLVWVLDSGSGLGYGYVDGVLQGSASYTGKNIGSTVCIGGWAQDTTCTSGFNANGIIDDFRVYNRALSATEVQSLYDLGASDKVNSSVSQNQGVGRLDSGLVGYWKLDDNTGTTATDSSTNANNGTLTNGPTWGTGKIGSDVVFDGTDDYITIPDSDALDVTDSTNFTLSGWFNRNTFATDDTIIAKSNGQAGSDTGYNVYIDDATDKLTVVANDGTDQYKKESVSTFTATGWHHFALSWDDNSSANTKLFIDGVSETTTNTGTFANVNSLANALTFRLGAESDNGNPFDGQIDEARVYNRALSDDEVSQLYRLTAPTGVDTSLKGYWSFNGSDLSGTTAYDRSGAGNNGTLTNGPTPAIGKLGQALSFGNTKKVTFTSPLGNNTDFSFSLWVKPNFSSASSADSAVMYIDQTNTRNVANIIYRGSGINRWKFVLADDSSVQFFTSANSYSFAAGEWLHLVGIKDATTAKLYINNTLVLNQAHGLGAINLSGLTGAMGYDNNTSSYLDGSLDEVRIYSRALSPTEIAALYNSGR